jgi:hypothetical protein
MPDARCPTPDARCPTPDAMKIYTNYYGNFKKNPIFATNF